MAVSLALILVTVLAGDPAPAPAPAPDVHVIDEKERIDLQQTDNVRLSLPTQSDRDAWASPGLRVQLGYAYGILQGTGPALSFRSKGAMFRPSVRLDEYWALGVAMLYGTGPNGQRWSVTAEPTFFPWRQVGITVGLGYGGLAISDPNASAGRLRGPDEIVSRDLNAGERLTSCEGSALSSLLRVENLFVSGALFATGPFAQVNFQWTRCQVSFGRIDQETGQQVLLTQWWRHNGATLGWWFAWR